MYFQLIRNETDRQAILHFRMEMFVTARLTYRVRCYILSQFNA